ncbi:NDR1/HIN1-like protein 10 [Aristolochia californica]|uniref:NDR1/HIN1-like protein 10 n=1 Tax=Aristolochia californica TaxID=171875 RepID=UPI0035E1057F
MGESYLNGTYYGPPIPPQRSYHRPGRSSGCFCGPCCLLSFFLKLIFTIVVVAGIIVLAVWLVLRPAKIKFHVNTVSLTDFNLIGGNTLRYNLSLSISVRNPNRRIGIYYKKLEAGAFYKGQRIQSTYLPTFYQGHKNTSMLYPVFSGQQFLALSSSDLSDYNHQKSQGRFRVDVKIYLQIRLKVWRFKTISYRPDAECKLTIPLSTQGEESRSFTGTKCDIDL